MCSDGHEPHADVSSTFAGHHGEEPESGVSVDTSDKQSSAAFVCLENAFTESNFLLLSFILQLPHQLCAVIHPSILEQIERGGGGAGFDPCLV